MMLENNLKIFGEVRLCQEDTIQKTKLPTASQGRGVVKLTEIIDLAR